MNNYMKFLADLANVDLVIEEEDKVLILLSSLLNEDYETFILTLINSKQSLSYNEVSSALVNHKLRKEDKESSYIISTEALTVKGISSSRKGKGDHDILKFRVGFRDLKKN